MAPYDIHTATGRRFNLMLPDPKDVSIGDIAHSLARQCRFNGHTDCFYSVAQHSVLVARLVPQEHRLAALLHDAAEAYTGDIIRPVKNIIGNRWRTIEEPIERAICVAMGIIDQYPWHASIKEADDRLLQAELNDLFGAAKQDRESIRLLGEVIEPWSIEFASTMFVSLFSEWSGGR